MLMTGMATKESANQFWNRALFGQDESGMLLVSGRPLAGKHQKVPPVKGDEHPSLRRSIAQLVLVASCKVAGFLCGTAIEPPFA